MRSPEFWTIDSSRASFCSAIRCSARAFSIRPWRSRAKTASSAASGSTAAAAQGVSAATIAASSATGVSSRSTRYTHAKALSCSRIARPRPTFRRTAAAAQSKPIWAATATTSTTAFPPIPDGTPVTQSTSAGPTANHASETGEGANVRSSPRRAAAASGRRASTFATAIRAGTIAGGRTRSIGTSASWTGRVRPSPTSNSIRSSTHARPTNPAATEIFTGSCSMPIAMRGRAQHERDRHQCLHPALSSVAGGLRPRPARRPLRSGEIGRAARSERKNAIPQWSACRERL